MKTILQLIVIIMLFSSFGLITSCGAPGYGAAYNSQTSYSSYYPYYGGNSYDRQYDTDDRGFGGGGHGGGRR